MRSITVKNFILIVAIVVLLGTFCLSGFIGISESRTQQANAAQTQQTSSSFDLDTDAILNDLKADLVNKFNKDLVKNVADYGLRGTVNAVITLSNGSMVSQYSDSGDGREIAEYLADTQNRLLADRLVARQNALASKLQQQGLVSAVKYNYTTILDGIYVTTTYENLQAICDFEGVGRVMVSNTYKPMVAVENPVNVYDTGIFNSSDVSYTGKGTVVAVLDTGCDYTHSVFNTHQVQDPLYSRSDIENLLPSTLAYSYDNSLEAREVYYGNITKDKIVFGYDYADRDPDVMPFSSEHGTHVAGIIGGYDSKITGVAIDTQLAIMKVFSDYRDGADDGDILAALEDSVNLGVDAINLSLGTSCGFSREVDDEYKNEIYDNIERTGISLVVAASNDYSSAYGSEFGNTNKVENPDSATVGAPSTYGAALSVASINGNKDKYMLCNGEKEIFFLESFNQNAKEYDFFGMLGITEGIKETYEYVTVPGYGEFYTGLDVRGKIALVKRGDISFEEKVNYAADAGAAALIVYNNVYGDIVMTVGNDVRIPVISIGKDDGEYLASRESGTIKLDANNQAGPFMSDFSSWGPNPDLKLKPEITAHGGNILSAIPGGDYDKLSGTSMAAPNMCGIVILIRQYVKENFPELTTPQVRDMVNQLCMSTATVALDKKGNPYSPRKQGAGIADIANATSTKAYLYVDGQNKTKLELGDDPSRSGVYTMTFKLKNISDSSVSYTLGDYSMTESLSADKKYVAEQAYMLSNGTKFTVKGGTLVGNKVTVAANKTAEITAVITLSDKDKAYINSSFPNGMYVEGFITLANTDKNGVDLNVPYLAFYGDWSDAPIFDKDYYLVETQAHNPAIDDDDKIKADYYATTPLGTYYYDYIIPMGSYLYQMDEMAYEPIPATAEHAALSYYPDTINGIYAVFTGLLRGAKEMKLEIVDTTTGKIVWQKTEYNCYKAHYSGTQYPYVSDFDLPMANYDTGEVFGDNNAHYKVTMTASLDWEGGERNINDTYSFSFYVDYQAPIITDSDFYTKYNRTTKKTEYYVDLTVYDNHYAMSLRPIVVYEQNGKRTLSDLTEYAIPVYQETRGQATVVTVEITNFLDIVRNSSAPEGLIFYVDDYALNSSVCYVPFPEMEANDLVYVSYDEMKSQGVNVDEYNNVVIGVGQTLDLTQFITGKDGREVNGEFLSMLTWESNGSAVKVVNGVVDGITAGGENDISFTSGGLSHKEKDPDSGEYVTVPEYVKISVKVSDEVVNSDNSQNNVSLDEIIFTGYDTLFAFTSDIDYSDIGETGSVHYFEKGREAISFYPSEKIKLKYLVKPLNMSPDRYRVVWASGNRRVAEVDQEGNVTAVAEGNTNISLTIYVDGVKSPIPARCDIEVKSEFIVENRELVAYKGVGGKVVIPDDKGILYIGSFAFCHYYLDNSIEVEDKYDFDKKKTPLGNNTVTSVVIPEGVEEIRKYAFYNSDKKIDGVVTNINDSVLTTVKLPTTLKKIEEYAFYNNQNLQDIDFTNVDMVSDYAFYNCRSLNCENFGGINLRNIPVIGKNAFENCTSLTSIDLSNLRRSGVSAFKGCTNLKKVVLGDYTRVAESMFENCTALSDLSQVNSDIIPDRAFLNCTALKSVSFKSDLTYLGSRAFGNCRSLNSVAFDGKCEYIGDFAFAGTSSLALFTLPNGDVRLGNYVFASNVDNTANNDIRYGASALNKLTFLSDTNITEMGVGVFFGINNLSFVISATGHHYDAFNGILYEDASRKKILNVNPSANLGDFVLPDSVEEIADGAFSGNTYLTSLTVNSTSALKKIGYGAFSYCDNLTKVNMPDSLALEMGTRAFYSCPKLTFVNFEGVAKIGDYAFWGTALKNTSAAPLNVTYDGVQIGEYAFADVTSLEGIHIGANAQILPYAFANSGLKIVVFEGDGVEIGESAFEFCRYLVSIDLNKAKGILGDYAFHGCYLLTEVSIANITEIGEGCFQACEKLTKVNATDSLKTVRFGAFSPAITIVNGQMDMQSPVPLATMDLSGVELIEGYAFLQTSLTEADLSNLSDSFTVDEKGEPAIIPGLGEAAFGYCENLKKVVFGEKMQCIADLAFYGCTSLQLSENDLQKVERIYSLAFYQVKLPQNLNLANALYIDQQAFLGEEDKTSTLVSVDAPMLEFLGMQSFANCNTLTTFSAPNLLAIDFGALSNTAVTELEISKDFEELGYGAMMGASKFVGFYVTDNSEKTFTYNGENFRLDDGVFYSKLPNGRYQLDCYPQAKADAQYAVLENTVRIEYQAAYGNKNLTKLILPATLRSIGNCAFLDCTNLTQVEFRSYYAPTLEGTLYSDEEITRDTVENNYDIDNFNLLYKYDYYYLVANEISIYYRNMLQYSNFIGQVASKAASNLTYIIPENNQGYDSVLYRAYFKKSPNNSGKTMGAGAIAFIDAVNALPDRTIDRFDKALVDAATTAYNALSADDMPYIDQSLVDKFLAARKVMNADCVRYTISNLYDMDATEYSYNALRNAFAEYNKLTAEEQSMVSNASLLDVKLAGLKKALKVDDIDFENPFSVYAPKDDGDGNPAKDNLALIVSLSCVGGVLVLGGVAALVAVLVLKKKKLANKAAEDSNEN